MAKTKSFIDLAYEANNLPIKELLEYIGCRFMGQGVNLKCISPFRSNASLGSFSINIPKNIFHDWALDIVGGPIKFYMEYYKLEFIDAVKKIASDFNLGNFHGRISDNVHLEFREILTPKIVQVELKKPLIDKVYRIFLDMIVLTDEDKQYLLDRGLSETQIETHLFRSYPRRTISFRKLFEEKVANEFGSVDVLFDVPGFFKKEGEHFNYSFGSGIIIPIVSFNNMVEGLQFRRKENVEDKYLWISSANCLIDNPNEKYERDGLSPGAPIGFMKAKWTKRMCITEGLFKALAIKDEWNMSSFFIQGVANWRKFIKDLPSIRAMYPELTGFVFFYDSDMAVNLNVLRQAKNFGEELLKQGFDVDYSIWKYSEEVKGIDDLISQTSNAKEHIKKVDYETIKSVAEYMLETYDNFTPKEELLKYFNSVVFEL